ncbi:MAG TPA: ATP-binding cassette domain-containing protein [archaeon]|nr:ATP-binding cassette domain-containing protein [archaeon]
MNAIEVNDLRKTFDKVKAVDSISFSVRQGEVFGLLGPNGAGKTTTLLMLATLAKPTGGTAKVNGFDVSTQPLNVRKSIGMVFQDPSSDKLLTAYENLKIHAMLYSVPPKEEGVRIERALKLVGLFERKDEVVKKYSGGMRRRLELARGLIHEPRVLYLDEPTLGLDPQARKKIWEYIEALARREKMTVVITTHYMEEADQLCDRVAIIDNGKIIALDTPENLKKVVGGEIVELVAPLKNASKLKKLKFVKRIEHKNNSIILTVVNAGKNLPGILKATRNVESVEVRKPTLEDVFLHFTGKKIREGESPERNLLLW